MKGQQAACIFTLSILLIDLFKQYAFIFLYETFFQISDNQTGIIINSVPRCFCITYIVIQILSRTLYSLHEAFLPV